MLTISLIFLCKKHTFDDVIRFFCFQEHSGKNLHSTSQKHD